jgi:lipopolysaccharide transport system ATP-binding protein
MSQSIIKVENLGKKYILGHQKQEKYTALRDVIAHGAKSVIQKITNSKFQVNNHEEFWALKDVSFEINRGDRVGIIGRNGAGKSTLLKILSRITEPTKGKIKIKGRVASLLEVGTGFHPELTGRENIFLNGAILGMSKVEIKQKFDEIVAFAEVEKFLDTPVKRYSSGMYVRLAFAVAAHLEPEILVVDEVLAVGDAQFQKKCLGKMEEVGKEGRTVLFVSHNMAAIKKLCNHGILLGNGKLTLQGKIEDAVAAYEFGAEFFNYHNANKNIYIREDLQEAIKLNYFSLDKISVLDLYDNEIQELKTGNSLKIRINYQADETIISPAFIISCKTKLGVELFQLCTSPISGYPLNNLKGIGYIDLVIQSLPLLGGEYYFDISLARSGVQRYFTIEQAIQINITSTDVYDSGFLVNQKHGLIAIPHQWNIKQIETVQQV